MPMVFVWGSCASVSLPFGPQMIPLPICLCVPLSFSLSASAPDVYHFTYISVLVSLLLFLSFYFSLCGSVCLCFGLGICGSVSLSLCVSLCLSPCLSTSPCNSSPPSVPRPFFIQPLKLQSRFPILSLFPASCCDSCSLSLTFLFISFYFF